MSDKPKKTMTPPFRASYAFVFRPREAEDGKKPKYGVCMLFPKKDPKVKEFLKALKVQCERVAAEHFPNGVPRNARVWPLRDGDTERDGEEFKGMYFINASSYRRPGVVDKDLNPLLDEEDFYSGCWARATINPFFYDNSGNKGVAIGLNNLQKVRDDEPLSGGSSAEEDFGGASGGSSSNDDDEDLL